MTAYYNEYDADKAAWLRELIKAGLIAPGEVDERDIQDVLPGELVGYTQCHFFAGIGIWSFALRCAGWPDDRRVWTGSCPCQPFSAAGKRGGTSDERHLWPAFFHLISINRPDVVFGEQVASKDGLAWLDTVQADLEAAAYAVGAVAIPACGFGAPHKRERLFFVADSLRTGRAEGWAESGDRQVAICSADGKLADASNQRHERGGQTRRRGNGFADNVTVVRLADANGSGRARPGSPQSEERRGDLIAARRSSPSSVADTDSNGAQWAGRKEQVAISGYTAGDLAGVAQGDTCGERLEVGPLPDGRLGVVRIKGAAVAETGVVNGFWRDADAILCNDEDEWKWRLTEPGAFPLAHGVAARVLRLRGYGDGIVAPVAEEFIRAYMEAKA